MNNKNFWDLLSEKQDSLTKSGTIIAAYLSKHAEEAQFLSISSLAKACITTFAFILPRSFRLQLLKSDFVVCVNSIAQTMSCCQW